MPYSTTLLSKRATQATSVRFPTWLTLPMVAIATVLVAACGEESAVTAPPASTPPIQHDLAILAIAIATGSEGVSFFDNFLPCLHRGLADYSNTTTGRQTNIFGCDIGGGVTFEGSGALDWTVADATPAERAQVDRVEFKGALTSAHGSTTRSISQFVVDAFYASGAEAGLHSLDSLWITMDGSTTSVTDTAAFRGFWDTDSRSITSIPNPNGTVAALTSADTRRLIFDAGLEWFLALIGESGQAGPHTHGRPCGVTSVTFDGLGGTPRLASTFSECPLQRGLVIDGDFVVEFTTPVSVGNRPASSIGWSFTGSFEVGGGIPRVSLSRIDLMVTIPPDLDGVLRVRGTVVGDDGTEIPYDFSVLVDD